MEVVRQRVCDMKCAACRAVASRTLVTKSPGASKKARWAACTSCYNRWLKGGEFWRTKRHVEDMRARQRSDAKQLRREENTIPAIAKILGVCASTVRNRLNGK